MKITLLGKLGPVARATHELLEKRGHQVTASAADCAIYFPGTAEELQRVASASDVSRLVLRSHASVYGSSPKNPGRMTEDRVSLLAPDAPEHRWLELEAATAKHPNAAVVRLTNVLAHDEGDLIVRQISKRFAVAPAGFDPNIQCLAVDDAAGALVAAAESHSTGVFNAAGEGSIPLKRVFQAAGTHRIPLLHALARRSPLGPAIDQLRYNWTVSSDRAARELGWRAARSTRKALADFIDAPFPLPDCDEWGLDTEYIQAWGAWFWFLRNIYWRIEDEGFDNVPAAGRALFVANHRGLMPLDAVMHLSLLLKRRNRVPRFLIIHSLLRMPFLCNFLTKLGGIIASQENAARLFEGENLVGLFPEGIRGAFTPYKQAYRLRDFSKSGFAKMAIEHQAPVVPAAVVGHAEIFPILARIESSYLSREWGWPFLPVAPMLPVPLPSKWHIRVLPPVGLEGLKPADAENPRVVKDFSRHIQHLIQFHIDEMTARRKHIFWGRIFHGTPAMGAMPTDRAAGEAR